MIAARSADGSIHVGAFQVYVKLPSSSASSSVVQWLLTRPALQQLGITNSSSTDTAAVPSVEEAAAAPEAGIEEEAAEGQQQQQEPGPEDGPRTVDVLVNETLAPSLEMVADTKGQCAFTATGTAQPAPGALAGLPLRPGRNALEFKCGGGGGGAAVAVAASLWLWEAHHTLIVSDIDGTISVSDVRGYINTVHLNRYEHTHAGVCRLYSHLAEAHGVRFLYLTSRPLSLLPATRAYLDGAVQDPGGHRLPPGPVICSPYGLARVLWKELIEKTIRAFKQQALLDVAEVFHRAGRPLSRPIFAAGFGNKAQDALAYMGAGVPSDAVFIINVRSEVRLHSHMEAAAAATATAAEQGEAEGDDEEEGEEGAGQRTTRTRLQELRRRIPTEWLGGIPAALNATAARTTTAAATAATAAGAGTATPPSPESAQAAAVETEAETETEGRGPVEAVQRITMVRGGSMDGAEEAGAGPSSSSAPFPPFSSYGDERLLRILEDVLAREGVAPCHEPQPPAPPTAPVGEAREGRDGIVNKT